MNFVGIGSLFAANPIASLAVASSTPAISNMMRPGFTTATHFSGAPLPLPMRVSAGFLVNGLSGKIRIHNFPPRLMKRVIATRDASICRSVIHAHSIVAKREITAAPRFSVAPAAHLLSVLHFLRHQHRSVLASRISSKFLRRGDRFAFLLNLGNLLGYIFALIHPALHANYAVRRLRFRGTVINVRAQCLQRQPSLQIPLFARDFRAIQPARHAHFDALAAEAQRRIHRFAHRPPERHALFELQRDRLRYELRVQLGTVHFQDVDVYFALGTLLHVLLQLVDLRALAPDDDAGPRGVNAHDQFVGGALDVDRADARALQFFLQLLAEFHVFVEQVGVVLVRIPARLVWLVVAQPESVRMRLLSHYFFPFFGGACFPVNALRTRRAVPRTPFCASASASMAATRCAAAT